MDKTNRCLFWRSKSFYGTKWLSGQVPSVLFNIQTDLAHFLTGVYRTIRKRKLTLLKGVLLTLVATAIVERWPGDKTIEGPYLLSFHLAHLMTFSSTPDVTYCSKRVAAEALTWLIYVRSTPDEFEERNLIRQTWASSMRGQVIFVTGLSSSVDTDTRVSRESEKEKDILRMNYMDTKFENTLKVASALMWTLRNCDSMKFYAVVDSDMVIFPNRLRNFLKSKIQDSRTIYGHIKYNDYWPFSEHDEAASTGFKRNVAYVDSAFYMMTGDSLPLLLNAYKNLQMNKYAYVEEAYITGTLCNVAGLKRQNISRAIVIAHGKIDDQVVAFGRVKTRQQFETV